MMAFGLLLGAAALVLAGYNVWEDHQAGENANLALELVTDEIPESIAALEDQLDNASSMSEVEYPDFVLNPKMDMPVKEMKGQDYLGVIEIPSLEMELPIISEWSDARLKIAPCRYMGSAYTGDMIISGHSYKNHFRHIRKLDLGDRVIFTDMDGNRFVYEITGTEVIAETDVEQMEVGEWDLTLFTCTPNGSSRHTVRCTLVEDENPWMKYMDE